jgi:tetratricopeptide (TPR) repeat protein
LLITASPLRGYALAHLASAYVESGRWAEARTHLDEAFGVAELLRDADLAADTRISDLQLRLAMDELSAREFVRLASDVLSSARDGSPYAARAKAVLAWGYALAGDYLVAERLIEEVVAGEGYAREPQKLLPSIWLDGPRPIRDVIARCERLLQSNPPPRTLASCYRALAVGRAKEGRFELAREFCERNRRTLDELGLAIVKAASASIEGIVELLADDPEEAERTLTRGIDDLQRFGETIYAAELAALLARAHLEQGCDGKVSSILESSYEHSAIEISSRVNFRSVRAQFLARSGFRRLARDLGCEAVDMADETDSTDLQAVARSALAQVLKDCGLHGDASAMIREALRLYECKGNLVEAAKTRAMLDP